MGIRKSWIAVMPRLLLYLGVSSLGWTILGCAPGTDPPPPQKGPAVAASTSRTTPAKSAAVAARPTSPAPVRTELPPAKSSAAVTTARTGSPSGPAGTSLPAPPGRTLAELLPAEPTVPRVLPAPPPLPTISAEVLRAHGIREIPGDVLTLYTDLPSSPEVDELPTVFAAAVPQWCAYFGIDPSATRSWRVHGCIMQAKERFQQAGLLPPNLPSFLNGYCRGAELWLYEQPSAYYRRHLLLHEGTHAFMSWVLGAAGPPWYMEGTAELFATHDWRGGQLQMRYFPRDKEEVPEWGRIKIVRSETAAGRGLGLAEVFAYDHRAHLRVEPYGWCWAAAAFLDGHPAYQDRFRQLPGYVRDRPGPFSERFVGWFREDAVRLAREWSWFVANLDYGYDVAREAFEVRPAAVLAPTGGTARVAADRGWQSTGFRLQAQQTYHLAATGRVTLARDPRPWWSEANGVTIRYHGGFPLGLLLGAVVPDEIAAADDNPFLTPFPVGTATTWSPPRDGVLFLRMNEAPQEWADNSGSYTVTVRPAGPAQP